MTTSGNEGRAPIETLLVRVHGRVQGVGYRYSCVQQARDIGVTGWVRNRNDGSVEAVLQGSPERVRQMCEWMRHEVPGASVTRFDAGAAPQSPETFHRFEQRPTT